MRGALGEEGDPQGHGRQEERGSVGNLKSPGDVGGLSVKVRSVSTVMAGARGEGEALQDGSGGGGKEGKEEPA